MMFLDAIQEPLAQDAQYNPGDVLEAVRASPAPPPRPPRCRHASTPMGPSIPLPPHGPLRRHRGVMPSCHRQAALAREGRIGETGAVAGRCSTGESGPMSELPEQYTGPGLFDLQVNGFAGFDFNGDPCAWTVEGMRAAAEALRRRGVTRALATLITDETALMLARARRYGELTGGDASLSEAFPALHLEGPFLSAVEGPRGAHVKVHCKLPEALPDLIERLDRTSGGRVALVTLAPELPGAIDIIAKCTRSGIRVAIGHTQASAQKLDEAVSAGAVLSTHLGNGCHPVLPRLDNYLQRQLSDDRLCASFIGDGHHVPLSTLKNFIRAKTPQRSILVSDAIYAAGLQPGEYRLGDMRVDVSPEGRVSPAGKDHLAGSAVSLDKGVVNVAMNCGASIEQAWAMASSAPARLLGMPEGEQVTVRVSEKGLRT